MKNFFKSRLGKCFLYTLLCVCIFVGVWALLGFVLYDFNYLNQEGIRAPVVMQFLGCSYICYIAITLLEY